MMKSTSHAALERHRDEILRLAALHGAENVRVFGSAARGEDRAGSDLDLLIRLEHGRSLVDLIAFKQDIEDLIHRPVDVVTDRSLSPRIRDRILRDASPL